jgi:lysophospholipase L1-like esterase
MISETRGAAARIHRAATVVILGAALVFAGCNRRAAEGEAASTTPSAAPTASAPAAVVATILADAGADAEAREPRKPREIRGKILCFGDSITQAEWPGKIAPEERWVTQLGKKSADIKAVNAGKNGRKTTAIDELQKAIDENGDAATVLLFLGVNDMKHETVGVVERATANLGKMVDLAREKLPKAEIVIMAPIDVNVEKLTPFFTSEGLGPDTAHFMRALAKAYESLAKKKGTRFINLYRAVSKENIEDGVHANGKGQIQIADAVWKGLTQR